MADKKRGFFITLEGPDGSGKSTQFQLLAKRLKQAGFKVLTTREPGGHPLAEKIRTLLLTGGKISLIPETELFLFLAARAQHVREVIQPALQARQVVICERFCDSTYAYQVGGRGLSPDFVKRANAFAAQSLKPDLTLLYDIPPQVGLKRAFQAKAGHDRIESESIAFQQKVRSAYLALARREAGRIKIIRGDQPLSWVLQQGWEILRTRIPSMRKRCHVL